MGMFCYRNKKIKMCAVVICKGFSNRVAENAGGRQIILKFERGGGSDGKQDSGGGEVAALCTSS